MNIDKSNVGEIFGAPGVKWQADGVYYNARWEEMEFVSVGVAEGDLDIYRVKPKVGRPPMVKKEAVIEEKETPIREKKTIFGAMRRDTVIKSLEDLGEEFNPDHNRMTLLNQLKHAQLRKTGSTK